MRPAYLLACALAANGLTLAGDYSHLSENPDVFKEPAEITALLEYYSSLEDAYSKLLQQYKTHVSVVSSDLTAHKSDTAIAFFDSYYVSDYSSQAAAFLSQHSSDLSLYSAYTATAGHTTSQSVSDSSSSGNSVSSSAASSSHSSSTASGGAAVAVSYSTTYLFSLGLVYALI